MVTASVFEPGGRPVREGAELRVRQRPLYLGVKVDADGEGSTPTIGFDIAAVDRSGARVAAGGVSWAIVAENWDYDWFQQDGRWQWRRTSRDVVVARGTVNVGSGAPAKLARRLGWYLKSIGFTRRCIPIKATNPHFHRNSYNPNNHQHQHRKEVSLCSIP